jgi:hypothetical protein
VGLKNVRKADRVFGPPFSVFQSGGLHGSEPACNLKIEAAISFWVIRYILNVLRRSEDHPKMNGSFQIVFILTV